MNAAQIARALGGHRSGNQWKCKCPAHDDASPSMIVFDGRHAVQVRCFAGCEPIEIIAALRSRGLWEGNEAEHIEDYDELRRRRTTPATDPNRHQVLALRIWDEAKDPTGTLAHEYLRCRGLELPVSAAVSAVRFHARCPKGGSTAPALVALMRNVETFEPQAVQRLFLERDELTGHVKKTEGMMLGPAGGAAMMITPRSETFWDDLSFCPRLYVCEGLETALALHGAGCFPVWALGSAGAIKNFPVIFGVGRVLIATDNDDHNVGLDAATACADRWNASTHQKATVIMPGMAGTDYADKLQAGK